ncbi:MAG TPA: HEPN domain-containing protein [Rhodospirillales bacterium]|nr:HEPN domain-containing protein [Rhodospirillales bacterium]
MAVIDSALRPTAVPAELLRAVVAYFRPRQVILFGSHARGDAGGDSDIDLAVVLDDSAPAEHLSARAAHEARAGFGRACDIVAWRASDFRGRAAVIGSLPHTVVLEGQVIFGERLDRRIARTMTPDKADPVAQWAEARRWLQVADDDLRTVDACLGADPPVTATAAYHCQQAAEKLLKALLVACARPTRKTHDLDELAREAGEALPQLAAQADSCRFMTRWNFAFRYPSAADREPVPPAAAEVAAARNLLARLRAAVAAVEPGRSEDDTAPSG